MPARTRRSGAATHTVLARIPARVIDLAVAQGMNRQALIDAAGLTGVDLSDGDARVPSSCMVAVWQLLGKSTEPDFGLRIGSSFKVREGGLLGYVMAYSATLEAALERMARYGLVLNDAIHITLERQSNSLAIAEATPETGVGVRLGVDYRLSALVSVCRQITAADIVPLEVDFVYAQPASTLEHRRFFRCPLRFNQPMARVVFADRDVHLALHHGDETLAGHLSDRAEQVVRSLTTGSSTKERVRTEIWNVLSDGAPSLARIASTLRVPPRTLQRRLAIEGTSFQAEVEEVRRKMAMALLRDPSTSTDEVAFLLGYAEASTLFRSFRRWTGMTPSQYRATKAA